MNTRILTALAFAATVLWAAPAFAAGGDSPVPSLIGYWINFAIFIGILVKFGKEPIQKHFKSRHDNLVADLDAAKKLRIEAEEQLAMIETKLTDLETEREQLLAEYREQGQKERDRIVEETKTVVAKLRSDAERQIEQDVRRAKAMIEERAVEAAVDLATNLAKTRIDDDVQNQLMRSYVDDLKGMAG